MSHCAPFMCHRDPMCQDTTCPGLLQRDGGHRVSNSDSMRLDPPLYSPEQTEGWVIPTLVLMGVFGAAILAAAFYWGVAPVWPFA